MVKHGAAASCGVWRGEEGFWGSAGPYAPRSQGLQCFFKNRAAAARQTLFVRECSVHDRVKAFTVIEERAAAWGERDQ